MSVTRRLWNKQWILSKWFQINNVWFSFFIFLVVYMTNSYVSWEVMVNKLDDQTI